MRKHVTPAHPQASIPDPSRARDLPPEGAPVAWSPYWAGLAARGDVVASEIQPEPEGDEPGPDPAPASSDA